MISFALVITVKFGNDMIFRTLLWTFVDIKNIRASFHNRSNLKNIFLEHLDLLPRWRVVSLRTTSRWIDIMAPKTQSLTVLRKNRDKYQLKLSRNLKSTSLTGKFNVIIKGKPIYIPGNLNIFRIIYYNYLNNELQL